MISAIGIAGLLSVGMVSGPADAAPSTQQAAVVTPAHGELTNLQAFADDSSIRVTGTIAVPASEKVLYAKVRMLAGGESVEEFKGKVTNGNFDLSFASRSAQSDATAVEVQVITDSDIYTARTTELHRLISVSRHFMGAGDVVHIQGSAYPKGSATLVIQNSDGRTIRTVSNVQGAFDVSQPMSEHGSDYWDVKIWLESPDGQRISQVIKSVIH